MFKVFNTVTGKKEVVKTIDYKIHFHVSGKPFDGQAPIEEETEETIEETIEEVIAAAPKRGRPKAN